MNLRQVKDCFQVRPCGDLADMQKIEYGLGRWILTVNRIRRHEALNLII